MVLEDGDRKNWSLGRSTASNLPGRGKRKLEVKESSSAKRSQDAGQGREDGGRQV